VLGRLHEPLDLGAMANTKGTFTTDPEEVRKIVRAADLLGRLNDPKTS
jgi:hypothetical protein